MTQYRLYLCDRVRIIGRQDFAARSDAEAVAVAAAIFEACSDMSRASRFGAAITSSTAASLWPKGV